MPVLYANRASSTLASSITNSATSFSVAAGQGSRFPTITAPDYFYATLDDNAGNIEIVKVTARSTDTFTVVRGQDGTSGLAFNAGATVELRVVKAMLDDFKTDARSGLQSSDADLTAIAALSGTSGVLKKTAANTWALDTAVFLTDANIDTYRPLIDLYDPGVDNYNSWYLTGFYTLGATSTNSPDSSVAHNVYASSPSLIISQLAIGVTNKVYTRASSDGGNTWTSWGQLVNTAPGASGNVLTSSGSAWVSQAPSAGGGGSADIQQFSTVGSSTWTKPSGAKMVHVVIFGGGGGGGSGRRRGTTTPLAAGGGGGGAGGRTEIWLPASSLGSTVTVTVGAGGSGAPGVTTNDTNGSAGGNGGTSSFGNFRARFGAGGSGATTSGTTSGGAPGSQIPAVTYTSTSVFGTAGTGGSNSIGDGGRGGLSPGSGGGGAGHTAGSTANYQGGMGGRGGDAILTSSYLGSLGGGGLAGAVNSNGGNGDSATIPYIGGDGGGGGGSGSPVGNGGNGGFPGGGGGGGAASTAVTSGAGGNGADGFVIVTTYF